MGDLFNAFAGGVFGGEAVSFGVDFAGDAALDFLNGYLDEFINDDPFPAFEFVAFNKGTNAFGVYNVLIENLLKFFASPSDATSTLLLLGVDFVVNDVDKGVTLRGDKLGVSRSCTPMSIGSADLRDGIDWELEGVLFCDVDVV